MGKDRKIETERRLIQSEMILRDADSDNELPELEGYASVFDQVINIAGLFREVIRPGAFTRAIEEKHDVRALFNHDPSLILARTTAGTLKLEQDDKGLLTRFRPANTQTGRDLVEHVRLGNINQMSFGFIIKKATWLEEENEPELRQIEDLELFDVSPVTYPAYDQTSIGIRAAEKILEHHHRQKLDKETAANFNSIALLRKKLDLRKRKN